MGGAKPEVTASQKARNVAARLAAVQAVYQMQANAQKSSDIVSEFREFRLGKTIDGEEMVLPDGILFERIVNGVSEHREAILTLLGKANPKAADIEPLLTSILACGIFELMVAQDIDAPLLINDYLNVTHAFYEQGETKLVNGILDKVSRIVRS